MNKVVKTISLWVFVGLLSISFVAYFGFTGGSLSQGSRNIATVNGIAIKNDRNSDFSDFLQFYTESYQRQGVQLNAQLSQYLGQLAFRQAVLNQLVVEKAEKYHYKISTKKLLDNLVNQYFKGDKKAFFEYQKDSKNTTTQRALEKKSTRRLLRNSYEDTLFTSIPFSEQEEEVISRVSAIEKIALISTLNLKDELAKKVTDKVLREYYQQNLTRYEGDNPATNQELLLLDNSSGSTDKPTANSSSDKFNSVRSAVLSDYLLENEDKVKDEIKKDIEFRFKTLEETADDDQMSSLFTRNSKETDMHIAKSKVFSYNSEAIVADDAGGANIVRDKSLVNKIFLQKINKISEAYTSGDELIVALVIGELQAPVEKKSAFVKSQTEKQLKRKIKSRILSAFYSKLESEADIVFAQQPGQ